jgi:hypothetical protein
VSWYLTKSGWIRLLDPKRLLYIAANFGRILWHLDIPLFNSIAVLAIYVGLVGFEKDKTLRRVGVTGLATISLMLAGYFCVYATSTIDLNWYLNTSLQRLYLQLWPSFLFCLFVTTRTPGTSIEGEQKPRRSSLWSPERRERGAAHPEGFGESSVSLSMNRRFATPTARTQTYQQLTGKEEQKPEAF